ncbi:MAG TPA: hypothetical protein VER33_25170 [Polyangiaceae bacterium]|nr:hypothetical protein [Polyangiaceae bacterium]
MARSAWLLSVASLVAAGVLGVPSCTINDGNDDDGGGESGAGGDSAGGGTTQGGTGGGEPGGAGGDVGNAGVTGDAGASGAAGAGGDEGGAGGNEGGAGGATSSNTCDAPDVGEAGAQGSTCVDYCTGFFSFCGAYSEEQDEPTFASAAECLQLCENFGDSQLCCRAYHVTLADTEPTTACPAAAGDAVCN